MGLNLDMLDYTLHYRRLHQFSDAYYASMARSYKPFLKHFPPAPARILDVGCGAGFLLNALMKAGYTAEGIDADPGQVDLAHKQGLPVQRIAVPDVLPYLLSRAGEFDAVTLIDVLEHVPRDSQIDLLSGIRTALKPSGRLVCQVPNALWPLASYARYIDWTHHFLFTRESLSFVLENAGFQVERVVRGHDRVSPVRNPVVNAAMAVTRSGLQFAVGCAWRVVAVSGIGAAALTHPISANLIAVAHQ